MPSDVSAWIRDHFLDSQVLRNCREDFPAFVQTAWPVIDGAPLVWGWFMQLLAEEMERWARREYRNLILAVPPGLSKSVTASVLLPAWIWLREPKNQFLCCAHSQELAVRDNVRMRDLVRSEWYQGAVKGAWGLKQDQDQKTRFANTAFGLRQGIGGKSGLAGWRGNDVIIDDPVDLNPRKPPRPEDLDAAFRWVQYIRSQRVNDPRTARTLLIAQRGFEDDPTGRLLASEPDDWHVVNFDMEYDPSMPFRHAEDPRTTEGELLFPERLGPVEVSLRRRALGPEQYSAQNQQQPIIPGGMIVKEDEIVLIDEPLDKYQYTVISWDLAFKGDAVSSWVVGTVWGINAPQDVEGRMFDLLDVWRDHVDFRGTKVAVERLALKWPQTNYVIIEQKANGFAVLNELSNSIPNLKGFRPDPYGDKIQRLRAITPIIAQGKFRVVRAFWNKAYVEELVACPKAKDMDQVDSTTQAILGSIHELPLWQATTKQVQLLGGW